MGGSSLGEYSSSPYSPDVAPNLYAVTNFQHESNSTRLFQTSRQDKDCGKQTSLLRKEAAYHLRRRSKDIEPKLENKRSDGTDLASRTTESSSYTALRGRNTNKSDRPIKAMNGRLKQSQNGERLPEPTFEITFSDFPKLQGMRSSDQLDLQKRTWRPMGLAEGDKLPLNTPEKEISHLINKESEVCLKKQFASRPLSSSSDPGVPQARSGFLTEALSSAAVPPQSPKRCISTLDAVLTRNYSGNKGNAFASEDCKSESRENASDNDFEETADRKKKKKKKKKKAKSNSEIEKPSSNNIVFQEPPRIEDNEEFPDLAAAANKKYKPGMPKSCWTTPVTRNRTEVITKESGAQTHNIHLQHEVSTPKPSGRKTDKLTTPASVEKRKTSEPSKGSGKKSQIPVQLDLGGMLAVLEETAKQSSKPVVLSVGGAVTLPSKESMTMTKSPQLNQGKTPHNPLDSSSPLVKKGKQREVPKAKKPTSLKKIILKEREQRKQQHLLEQMAIPKDDDDDEQGAESAAEDSTHEETRADSTEDVAMLEPPILAQGNSELDFKSTEPSGSTENSLLATQPNSQLPKIHSRRFRDYCTQVLSKDVDNCVTDLLSELVRFQDRLYQKDPVKAKMKRRLVMGLREVLKHLKLKKLKCVIISPNCEKIQSKGGLDETLHLIIDSACEQNIPFVFALNRKALGRCVNKAVPVSVVGIFSYDGAQDYFHKMVELTMEARQTYKEMIAALERDAAEENNESVCADVKTSPGENSQLEPREVPLPESDEDVPEYIKIWRRKLEEQYKPYILNVENQLATETLSMGFEELQ